MLTHAFWMRRFAGDPAVLERPLRLNNTDFTVVGVAEPGFRGHVDVGTDLWVPMSMVRPRAAAPTPACSPMPAACGTSQSVD